MTARAAERVEQRSNVYCRALDVVVSFLLVMVALPVIVMTAIGSALVLRAWPFFTQERVGLDGRRFQFVKVRTLPTDVPSYTDKHHLAQVRIPRFCQVLRALHLDELPQLLLVLRGHMSLVGPRPEMAYLHDQLPADFAGLRTSTRPGCTGLWQISEAASDLIGDAPEYDRFYLRHRTLRLDLWVMVRTAANMIGVGRSVTLADVPSWAMRADRSVSVIDLRDVIDLERGVIDLERGAELAGGVSARTLSAASH